MAADKSNRAWRDTQLMLLKADKRKRFFAVETEYKNSVMDLQEERTLEHQKITAEYHRKMAAERGHRRKLWLDREKLRRTEANPAELSFIDDVIDRSHDISQRLSQRYSTDIKTLHSRFTCKKRCAYDKYQSALAEIEADLAARRAELLTGVQELSEKGGEA